MNKQTFPPHANLTAEQSQQKEEAVVQPTAKKMFVEPTVSVPADVLEATTFFQTPTIEGATV